ncbi:MAG: tetratricopeptide repeat protein [Betaproteobacteria bacterium]|nr:tetratricopeptide repeat protein [Betaproteobacteria bacterium]MDE2623322.1 tetratricopeptide repeat protein [Betaproteobacteria bacterium]
MPDADPLQQLIDDGRPREALALAQQMAEEGRADAPLLHRAGLCAAAQGDAGLAERFWRQALAAGPEQAATHFNLGVMLGHSGRHGEAFQHYARAAALDPGNAAAHANLALLYEQRGDPLAAEASHRTALSLDPQSLPIRFNLANWLAASPRTEQRLEARELYLDILRRDSRHFGAWNNLGTLLFETGFLSAAQTAYTAAITHHPQEGGAHLNLANLLLHRNELDTAREQFLRALDLGADSADVHRGLASCHARLGDEAQAAYHRALGYGARPLLTIPHRGANPAVPLLILASAEEGNIPWRFLIDPSHFHTTILATEYIDAEALLPPHDLLFNAIGDADRCAPALQRAARLVARSPAPCINRPEQVLLTGRATHAARLQALAGLKLPRVSLLPKSQPAAFIQSLAAAGLALPVLLRSPGYHGGQFFVRVDTLQEVEQALAQLPGNALLALEILDARGADGLFRKFRMMSIDGRLHPIHLALARHWKVHYFSSEMAQAAPYRAEEAAFLDDPAGFLGPTVMDTLARLQAAIGLDYFGMDFGLDAAGQVLLFEANATMVLQPPTDDPLWDYRRPAMESALEATRTMLRERARKRAGA